MTPEEEREQEELHEAIVRALPLEGEGDVLTGWVLCYEAIEPDGSRYAGHFYGPRTMTAWLALGLLRWAQRGSLDADVPEDDP